MLAALSVIASLSMSFSFSIIPMTPDLDPSFVYSFNHAAARGLRWGPDFISTYALAGVLAGFYTLIKLSLGLGALMTLASGCLVVWRPRLAAYRSAVTILAATGGFLIAWLACGGTLAGVRPYLTTGWEVSKGY